MMRQYILTADIGATNTKIALYTNNLALVEFLELKTAEIRNSESFVMIVRQRMKIKENFTELSKQCTLLAVCIACAGPVNDKQDKVQLTNSKLSFDTKTLNTQFKKENVFSKNFFLLNDFEALSYGLNKFINSSSAVYRQNLIMTIKKGKSVRNKTIAVIGAGTGLGKSIGVYNQNKKIYEPLASEGGHADFPIQNYFELQLADYIKKQQNRTTLCYEDLLSGRGIINIYDFLYSKYKYILKIDQLNLKKKIDTSDDKAALISKYRKTDFLCKETFKLFTKYFAISLRIFALETMPISGIYISGGIAAKNKDIFNVIFVEEFEKHDVCKKLLKDIPIYLITDKIVSLYGCGLYAKKSISLI